MKVQPLIAILLPDLRPGGAERVHVNMAHNWISKGFAVDFVLLGERGELIEVLPQQARTVDLKARRYRGAVLPLRNYIRRESPAVLLAAMWPLTVVALLAQKLAHNRTRVVVSDHSLLSKSYEDYGRLHYLFLRLSMMLTYRFANARIAVSNGVAAELAWLSGIQVDKFEVIYNPVVLNSTAGQVHALPRELKRSTGPIILSVGSLKRVKNHELLLEAFSLLPAEINATLCILGEGSRRPLLEDVIQKKGLQGRVLLPGFRAETTPWYQHADLFVLSSNHEGFGNVLVESLESGVPVVSTDCPSGPREILCEGKYGELVPVNDPDALALAMTETLSKVPDKDALRSRASDFSVSEISQMYLKVMFCEDYGEAVS